MEESKKEMTREEIQASRPSLDLFPQMMSSTRLLIIDYDVTRVHSFDIFRMLLLDEEYAIHVDKRFYPILTAKDYEEQLAYYIQRAYSLNPIDLFMHTKDKVNIVQFEELIPTLLKNDIIKVSPTDIMDQFGICFSKKTVTGYLLRYESDTFPIPWIDKVKVFTSKQILNMRMASAIIQQYQINAVMCASIECAIILANRLDSIHYNEPITFIVGRYMYNYLPEYPGVMRMTENMYYYTIEKKYEYGTFTPFANLQLPNRRKEEMSDDQHPV